MPPRRKILPRCAFRDNGERCRRPGTGSPPMCAAHYEPANFIDQTLNAFLNHPKVQGVIDDGYSRILGVADRAQGWVEGVAAGKIPLQVPRITRTSVPHPPPPPHKEAKRPPPPPPRPAAPSGEDPRIVLGFGAKEPLTRDKVKQRKKKLAELIHPDRGGATDAMSRINRAADQLLASLKT